MNRSANQILFGIDANEANLVKSRVGSNQFAYGLLKALEKVDRLHKYVIYLSAKPLSDMPTEGVGWEYRILPPPKLWTQWRLPLDLYLYRPRPDIFLSLSHYVPRFSPIPRIVVITDLGYLKFPEQFLKKDLWQLRLWTAHSIRVADHIIAISEFTKKDIIESYNIDPSKTSVVYPGFDREIFKESLKKVQKKNILRKYKIDSPYLLFLGSLRPSKNIERLIEAFNKLKENNLKLVIAGKKGWLYQTIFEKINQLKLQNRVIFTGFVSANEIPYMMTGAGAFILPSLYEGFGMPLVEAMACGVPVVASNICSIPEVVGNAGVLINPYSVEDIAGGITKALSERDKLIKKGFLQANKFSWEKSAQKVIEILEGRVRR